MGLLNQRRETWETSFYEAQSIDDLKRLADLRVRHAALGAQRQELHAAIFAVKQTLRDAAAAYRDCLAERLQVQAEMALLAPASPKATPQVVPADVLAQVIAVKIKIVTNPKDETSAAETAESLT